jgi:hypothetical protein
MRRPPTFPLRVARRGNLKLPPLEYRRRPRPSLVPACGRFGYLASGRNFHIEARRRVCRAIMWPSVVHVATASATPTSWNVKYYAGLKLLAPNTTISHYRIVTRLGAGGGPFRFQRGVHRDADAPPLEWRGACNARTPHDGIRGRFLPPSGAGSFGARQRAGGGLCPLTCSVRAIATRICWRRSTSSLPHVPRFHRS